MLQSNIEHRLQQLHDDYTGADPFPHVVIDEFFAADYAERLLAEFPPFEAGNSEAAGPDLVALVRSTMQLGSSA